MQAGRRAGKGSLPWSAWLRGCGTLDRGMVSPDRVSEKEHVRVRVLLNGAGESNVSSGLPVLDHLLGLLARYGSLDLELQVAPERAEAEIASAGKALGEALRVPLSWDGARGHGSAAAAADEALAQVVLDRGRPLVVSNVDLSEARIGGLSTDLVASFLRAFAEGGGLTLHVRLIGGDDSQHVLEAISRHSAWRSPRQAGPGHERSDDGGQDRVRTENAPAPFQGAPYSQAIKAAGLVFVSGQLPLAPGGTAAYELTDASSVVVRNGGMTQGPPGTYTAVISSLDPTHGYAGNPSPFPVRRRQRGRHLRHLRSERHRAGHRRHPRRRRYGHLAPGRHLERSFVPVPDGAALDVLANRHNPDLADGAEPLRLGRRHRVLQGSAERAGCISAAGPARDFAESAIFSDPAAGHGSSTSASPATLTASAAHVAISHLDTPPGDDDLRVKATLPLASEAPLDPIATGLRLVLTDHLARCST